MSDPHRQVSNRRIPNLPGNYSNRPQSSLAGSSQYVSVTDQEKAISSMTPEIVKAYLKWNRGILEEYVTEDLDVEDRQDLIDVIKNSVDSPSKAGQSNESIIFNQQPELTKTYSRLDIVGLQQHILDGLTDKADPLPFIYEVLHIIGCAINADGCSLYAVKPSKKDIHLYIPPGIQGRYQLKISGPIGEGYTVAAYVAHVVETVLVRDFIDQDDRFPQGIGVEGSLMQSVLAAPVTFGQDSVICILEFTRTIGSASFGEKEMQCVNAIAAWMGACVRTKQRNCDLERQQRLYDFLLHVSRLMFQDINAMDELVQKIMGYTKDLVEADRCALFLLDEKSQEMISSVFDEGIDENGKHILTKKEEIRFPMSKGIAGHVARTGDIINIADAYEDPRFNREIDRKTGYTTKSILCMPIISEGNIIGVLQMVNKRTGDPFNEGDVSAFKMFAVYCAVALHYSKILEDIHLKTAQYQVAMEQITYHIHCTDDEMATTMRKAILPPSQVPPNLDSFHFYAPLGYEELLLELFVNMCHDLFGPKCFDLRKFCTFLLTIKKSYRPVPYHNWKHGFNVAHCMYCMMKAIRGTDKAFMSTLQEKATLIAALCHDVDHRGFNNNFVIKMHQPLADLYPSSIMEQHHYAHTISVLQQPDCNIFSNLSSRDYKLCVFYIKEAILATDLALYFPNQKNISRMLLSGSFDLKLVEHQSNLVALMMTGADLSASIKNWNVQQVTVKGIYEEFYLQGDEEKRLGQTPLPMMDRNNAANLPKDQIGFMKFVCLPCYQTLYDSVPEFKPMVDGCLENLHNWECVAEGKSISLWEPEKSVPHEKETE